MRSNTSLPHSLTEGRPSSSTSTPRTSRIVESSDDTMEENPPTDFLEETQNAEAIDAKGMEKMETTTEPSKSPSLNSKRNSNASELRVGGDATQDRGEEMAAPSADALEKSNPPKPPSRVKGLSMPWGPPPMSKATELKPTPAPNSRKIGMGFSWLSRKPSATIDAANVPAAPSRSLSERRNTTTSMASINSNPELMLTRLDEANDSDSPTGAQKHRNSLRDRFKMLRMREEAGIQSLEGQEPNSPDGSGGALAGLIGRSASVGVGIGSPTSVADEKEGGLAAAASPLQSPTPGSPGAIPTAPDPKLAPGTAVGMAAGPSMMGDPAAPVDWDLWQAVVYEGPSAVARTSAEELGRAIASGIPSAIRGVVWQVLAQSKNEELETVYRELVVRGTDKDRELNASLQGHAPSQSLVNGSLKEKKSVASSASSIHSDHSTPATSATNGMTSPSPSQDKETESALKLHTAMMAERKKKAQEDKAAIMKLEKAIRRDLGARTSYSKYAVAAGLQDGLFGVCKAYALFDEGVGYAQGMNFLVMPLLFNVNPLGYSPRLTLMIARCLKRKPFVSSCD